MLRYLRLGLVVVVLAAAARAQPSVPPPGAWETRAPEAVGMDAAALAEAVGPFPTWGPQTGVILKDGYVVAAWGEPDRVDPTFSVAKSALSSVAAVRLADGRIGLDDEVWRSQAPVTALGEVGPGARPAELGRTETVDLLPGAHNRAITWNHLLRQTSAWRGELWGKPDWADRPDRAPETWLDTTRAAPGTVYEHDDTRVNALDGFIGRVLAAIES